MHKKKWQGNFQKVKQTLGIYQSVSLGAATVMEMLKVVHDCT